MRKRWIFLSLTLLILVLGTTLLLGYSLISGIHHSISRANAVHSHPVPTPVLQSSSQLAHIFIIVDENQPFSSIIGNSNAPYLNSLANHYGLATNYQAITHPSLPNYLALTSGSTDGLTTDCNPPSAGCEVNVNNIGNQLDSARLTWKEYAESMPSDCYAYNDLPNYATKHVPFLYYSDIIGNSSLCASHVVPFSQMAVDLKTISTTPDFAFITPNLCNDMHNCSVATGDKWLAQNVPLILGSPAFRSQNSLLVITWDEGTASTNHIATILVGNSVKKGYQSALPFNHYSLLHTIEANWSLPNLTTNVSNAPLMNQFF